MNAIIHQGIIEDLKDFDHFKSTIANSHTYVASKLIHEFYFKSNQMICVYESDPIIENVMDSIFKLLDDLGELFPKATYKKSLRQLSLENGSRILFLKAKPDILKGRTFNVLYTSLHDDVMKMGSMEKTDYPNLFKRIPQLD